jgi:hypothetical protein
VLPHCCGQFIPLDGTRGTSRLQIQHLCQKGARAAFDQCEKPGQRSRRKRVACLGIARVRGIRQARRERSGRNWSAAGQRVKGSEPDDRKRVRPVVRTGRRPNRDCARGVRRRIDGRERGRG